MNVAVIGVGGAGGRIVDLLVRRHGNGSNSPLASYRVIDTDRESLAALDSVRKDARQAVGQFETGGEGTDSDRDLGMEVAGDQRIEIRRAVEAEISTTIDAIVLVSGLGGGTGSALTPALASGLANVYEMPLYTVSILPSKAETDGNEQVRENTAKGLTALEGRVETQIVFDNDAWLWGNRSLETHGDSLNRELVDRLSELLTAGQANTAVGQRAVDSRDVMETLNGGGITTLGAASRPISAWREASVPIVDRFRRRLLGDDTDELTQSVAIQRTLNWATQGTLTFECPREAARQGLVIFSGPPEWLRGDAIASGREWLAEQADIAALRSGDMPTPGATSLGVFVVFSGITDAPRLDAFEE